MTEREALKMALEALEVCEQSNYGRNWVWPDTAHPTAMSNVKEAITAIREVLAQQEQEPVARYFEDYQGQPIEEIDEARFNQTPEECRFKLYTAPPQPEQSQVEETLRYEIDALEAKLAECRAQQQEPVIGTKTWFEDGKVVTQHLTAKDIYKEPEQEPVAECVDDGEGGIYYRTIKKHIGLLYTAPPQPEPVIDKSAAIRIATSLGWTPQRTWVGLTDEDCKRMSAGDKVVAMWADRTLKEKNT